VTVLSRCHVAALMQARLVVRAAPSMHLTDIAATLLAYNTAVTAGLRGDDAILNCCLYFQRTLHKRVVLCTDDRYFLQIAKHNGIDAVSISSMHVSKLP
jgi:rRNA-processing protein FCF1